MCVMAGGIVFSFIDGGCFSVLKMLIGLRQGERGGTLSPQVREKETPTKPPPKKNKDDGDDGDPQGRERGWRNEINKWNRRIFFLVFLSLQRKW
jgi:hypothetical protein